MEITSTCSFMVCEGIALSLYGAITSKQKYSVGIADDLWCDSNLKMEAKASSETWLPAFLAGELSERIDHRPPVFPARLFPITCLSHSRIL